MDFFAVNTRENSRSMPYIFRDGPAMKGLQVPEIIGIVFLEGLDLLTTDVDGIFHDDPVQVTRTGGCGERALEGKEMTCSRQHRGGIEKHVRAHSRFGLTRDIGPYPVEGGAIPALFKHHTDNGKSSRSCVLVHQVKFHGGDMTVDAVLAMGVEMELQQIESLSLINDVGI